MTRCSSKRAALCFQMRLQSQVKSVIPSRSHVVGTSTSLSGRFLMSAVPQMAEDEESPLLVLNGEMLISQSIGKI